MLGYNIDEAFRTGQEGGVSVGLQTSRGFTVSFSITKVQNRPHLQRNYTRSHKHNVIIYTISIAVVNTYSAARAGDKTSLTKKGRTWAS